MLTDDHKTVQEFLKPLLIFCIQVFRCINHHLGGSFFGRVQVVRKHKINPAFGCFCRDGLDLISVYIPVLLVQYFKFRSRFFPFVITASLNIS